MTWARVKTASPRKFIPGDIIPLSAEAIFEIAESHQWYFHGSRVIHSAALKNMSLTTVRSCLFRRSIRKAIINPEWIKAEREKFLSLDWDTQYAITST